MPSQFGGYDTLRSLAGKVFTYLASITLAGVDGKTLTVNKSITLTAPDDTAVATLPAGSHSLVPADSPSFSGTVTKSETVKEIVNYVYNLDDTIVITLTFVALTGQRAGHVVEIFVALADTGGTTCYSSIVRYSVTTRDTQNAVVADMTHDLVGGVTESVTVGVNTIIITLTLPGAVAIDRAGTQVKCLSASPASCLESVTVA